MQMCSSQKRRRCCDKELQMRVVGRSKCQNQSHRRDKEADIILRCTVIRCNNYHSTLKAISVTCTRAPIATHFNPLLRILYGWRASCVCCLTFTFPLS